MNEKISKSRKIKCVVLNGLIWTATGIICLILSGIILCILMKGLSHISLNLLTSKPSLLNGTTGIGNIVMLMPLGVFLCLMYRRLNVIHIGTIGCACSVYIELTQYFTGRGLLEFDDIFHNTLGAVIGCFIMKRLFMRIKVSEGRRREQC